METGPGASNALRSRRPTPTHTASEPRRQRTPARRQSAYPFQPMPVSFLSDSSDDSEHTSPSPSQSHTAASSQSHSHSHSHSHTSSQTSSHYADPVSRFGIPYARKNQSRPSLGTPRASFSASSDSSAPHPRTPGSQDSGRWREAGVVVGGGGGLQQDAWLAHVAEEMAASLARLTESVRAARAELDETRAVLDARRTRVLLAASGSTESWSASAFDPAFRGPPFVPASQSGESYYSASTSGGQVASPSFFTTASTTSSISYSSMSYSEASTAESPSYSSFYTTSPSASMSQGSFA